ncbi:MAG TPA: glycerate kinase, partial [Burkholderiaceae bacterium]
MNTLRKFLVPLGCLLLLAAAWRNYGWQGALAVAGGLLMWLLLHYTRLMKVMQRAANRPVGYVGSAVMLNAKLKPGMALIHVVALTRALGSPESPSGVQPEIYRWTDGSASYVT